METMLLQHNQTWDRREFPTLSSCSPQSFGFLFFICNQGRESPYKVTGLNAESYTSLSHRAPPTESIQTQRRHQSLPESYTDPVPSSSEQSHLFMHSTLRWVQLFNLNPLDWGKMNWVIFYLISIIAIIDSISQTFYFALNNCLNFLECKFQGHSKIRLMNNEPPKIMRSSSTLLSKSPCLPSLKGRTGFTSRQTAL